MRSRFVHQTGRALLALGLLTTGLAITAGPGSAAEASVGLGTAGSYAVLAGSTVTNTGTSVVRGDVGLHPGTAVVGLPSAMVTDGTIHTADAAAAEAQADATTAFDDAAGRSSSATVLDLGGALLVPGVYTATTSLALTGTVTLDAQGDPSAVFVFQAGTTLTTASGSAVALVNGASPCNVFWQVGSSATLGTDSVFVGTVLALESISATTRATIEGRLLARNGAVTLDTNTITRPVCAAASTGTTTTTTSTIPSTVTAGTTADLTAAAPAAAPASTSSGATTSGPPAGASDTSTATGRTTTATSRPTTSPPLARTGFADDGVVAVALLLFLLGTALTWIGRRPLLHAR